MELKKILEMAIAKRATDIHLIAGKKVCIRVNGDLEELDESSVLDVHDIALFLDAFLEEGQRDLLEKEKFILTSKNLLNFGRFRVHISAQRGSRCISLKLASNINDIKDLDLHPTISKFHSLKHGLILVAGPALSGKSVTCAKLIDEINQHSCRNIVTIESPIAYLLKHERSIVKQMEIGLDVEDHLRAMKSAILDDSDVIFIDDISGSKVFELAIKATEKGKLVIGCLATQDVNSTIHYLLNNSTTSQETRKRLELSQVLKAVVAQKVIPMGEKKSQTIYEILLNTPTVKRLIIEGKLNHLSKVMASQRNLGMMTFDDHITELIEEGVLPKEVGKHHASNHKNVVQISEEVVL